MIDPSMPGAIMIDALAASLINRFQPSVSYAVSIGVDPDSFTTSLFGYHVAPGPIDARELPSSGFVRRQADAGELPWVEVLDGVAERAAREGGKFEPARYAQHVAARPPKVNVPMLQWLTAQADAGIHVTALVAGPLEFVAPTRSLLPTQISLRSTAEMGLPKHEAWAVIAAETDLSSEGNTFVVIDDTWQCVELAKRRFPTSVWLEPERE